MSSLYKDAIADARKLRETAEQNAKNRIIEAVTPKLRSLIERQIAEGGDDLLDDDLESSLLDTPDALDLLDDEEPLPGAEIESMETMPEPIDVDSDGLASIEIIPDEDEEPSIEDESQNKSVHVNITVEAKNKKLQRRAIRLVKALSEAKSNTQRKKIRKEMRILRRALIITENSQNIRLAKNLSVILKESNDMRRRRNSWLFEGGEPEAGSDVEFDDMDFDDDDDKSESESGGDTIEVDASALEDALGLEPGALADASADSDDDDLDLDDDDDDDDADDSDDDALDLGESDEMGDEAYESMGDESDELDQCESDEMGDEVVEVNEAMLRRALRSSRRNTRRSSRRVNESRKRRIARARRRRQLREGEAKAAASSFGGGKAGKDMFVEVDENTLLNALAEELGTHAAPSSKMGSAKSKASAFGGGQVKSGAVMESRRVRRQLSETRKVAKKNARIARAAKAELKESNLFNAKLLYVTKLMQQHTLNNKQQRAIIEAMDNAKTQREAKLLFTSLNESLNKRKLNEGKEAKASLNESRTSYSNRSLQSGQAPRNSGVELDRWAVLAGIKK